MWRSKLPAVHAQREEQERRKITQQEVAAGTGIRQATISAWMNWGTFKRLDADVVGALASYYAVRPEQLYEFEQDIQGQTVGEATANA
jgi:transcriptional regulator with XRE-family HTH domain